MRVMLHCVKVEKIEVRKYRATMKVLPDGKVGVIVELDCAGSLGTLYELTMKGVFTGYAENRPCIGGVLSFEAGGKLSAVDIQDETKWIENNTYQEGRK